VAACGIVARLALHVGEGRRELDVAEAVRAAVAGHVTSDAQRIEFLSGVDQRLHRVGVPAPLPGGIRRLVARLALRGPEEQRLRRDLAGNRGALGGRRLAIEVVDLDVGLVLECLQRGVERES
jgi:hypothetical protein